MPRLSGTQGRFSDLRFNSQTLTISHKVRCDVSQRGRPCMNCYLDNETCVVTSRATRRYVYLLSPIGKHS